MMKKEKSIGIIVVGCLAIAGPIYHALHGILKIISTTNNVTFEFNWFYLAALVIMGYQILCGIFVMKFKNWARISLIVIYIFVILSIVVTFVVAKLLFEPSAYITIFSYLYWLVGGLAVVVFLLRPKIKEKFKQ